MARRPHPLSVAALGPIALVVLFGCGAKSPPAAAPSAVAVAPSTPAAQADDVAACAKICQASASCGAPLDACVAKCDDLFVVRGRPGIAKAAAACAVPRIEHACTMNSFRGSTGAFVACIDQAGRATFASDRKPLLVAARAICDRAARCGAGTPDEARVCIDRLSSGTPPKGLGVFGALKAELVDRFASCMTSSSCSEGTTASCFAGMLGETDDEVDDADGSEEGADDEPPAIPTPTPTPPPGAGGTKI